MKLKKIYLVPFVVLGYMFAVAIAIRLCVEAQGIEVTTANFVSVILPISGMIGSLMVGLGTFIVLPITLLLFSGDSDEH